METNEFRAVMSEIGLSQGGLSRIFRLLGDTASSTTILRRVERWAQGASHIPGEAAAFLNVLRRYPWVRRQLVREATKAYPPRRPGPSPRSSEGADLGEE